ncbi:hypothetical protein [Anaerocolumna jejuensis]|uniref:hypothetical protein n=1 Tax=Anaerocolumna jejuensis TaxID=259063 RepID=UPI003F7BC6F1
MKKKDLIYLTTLSLILIMLFVSIPITTVCASNYDQKHLIAKNTKEKIYLYYDKESDGMYKGFYLKSGSKVKHFDWESSTSSSAVTSVSVINGNYIAVICTIGTGSGVHTENLYVLNKKTLKVLKIENPLDVLKDNVISKIDAPVVKIKIDNNTWTSTCPDTELSHFFNTVGYESIIQYDLQDTYFTVTLPAQVAPAFFIGEFKLTYKWKSKSSTFIPTAINFNFEDAAVKY